jgi:DNA-binding CsgD family transcriptional regulator
VFEGAPNSNNPKGGLSSLSRREREVLGMAALGLTNAQMADQLSVTVHAVKFHLASIYRKLGVANRTEAAVMYLQASERLDPQPLASEPAG